MKSDLSIARTITRTLRVLRGVPTPGSNDRSYVRIPMLRVIATHLRRRVW